ncbi:MAG: hypothetical protein FWH27_01715 [Planctomycetaceae bacterium]|nr:hypothetical protein [Planctomycetaceae bacterium]
MNLANLDPKKREQYLMILCGVMLVIAVIPLGIYLFGADVVRMQKKIESTKTEIQELETKRTASLNFEKRIRQAAADALPLNNELAAAEYKNWLTSLTTASQFEGSQVSNTGTTPVRAKLGRGQTGQQGPDTYYTNYKFSVSGKTTLNNLGRFLQQFYSVKTQHLIRSMTIKPSDAQRIDVTMTIEAISVPQTPNKTFEAKQNEDDTTDWQRMIATVASRNFFAAYVAPQSDNPRPQPPVPVSAAMHTYLNGVTWSNDRPQAWFSFRLEGRQAILKVGDRFRVGEADCRIESINDDRTVEIRVTSRDRDTGETIRTLFSLMIGDTFSDAVFLADLDDEEGAT